VRIIEPDGMKVCADCEECLPLASFYPNPRFRHRVDSRCKPCIKKYNRQRVALRSPEQRQRVRTQMRRSYLLRKYKIDESTYQALLDSQSGACAICRDATFGGKPPCVDHCHETGSVRGILCNSCNLGIGYLGDKAERIQIAVEYLARMP